MSPDVEAREVITDEALDYIKSKMKFVESMRWSVNKSMKRTVQMMIEITQKWLRSETKTFHSYQVVSDSIESLYLFMLNKDAEFKEDKEFCEQLERTVLEGSSSIEPWNNLNAGTSTDNLTLTLEPTVELMGRIQKEMDDQQKSMLQRQAEMEKRQRIMDAKQVELDKKLTELHSKQLQLDNQLDRVAALEEKVMNGQRLDEKGVIGLASDIKLTDVEKRLEKLEKNATFEVRKVNIDREVTVIVLSLPQKMDLIDKQINDLHKATNGSDFRIGLLTGRVTAIEKDLRELKIANNSKTLLSHIEPSSQGTQLTELQALKQKQAELEKVIKDLVKKFDAHVKKNELTSKGDAHQFTDLSRDIQHLSQCCTYFNSYEQKLADLEASVRRVTSKTNNLNMERIKHMDKKVAQWEEAEAEEASQRQAMHENCVRLDSFVLQQKKDIDGLKLSLDGDIYKMSEETKKVSSCVTHLAGELSSLKNSNLRELERLAKLEKGSDMLNDRVNKLNENIKDKQKRLHSLSDDLHICQQQVGTMANNNMLDLVPSLFESVDNLKRVQDEMSVKLDGFAASEERYHSAVADLREELSSRRTQQEEQATYLQQSPGNFEKIVETINQQLYDLTTKIGGQAEVMEKVYEHLSYLEVTLATVSARVDCSRNNAEHLSSVVVSGNNRFALRLSQTEAFIRKIKEQLERRVNYLFGSLRRITTELSTVLADLRTLKAYSSLQSTAQKGASVGVGATLNFSSVEPDQGTSDINELREKQGLMEGRLKKLDALLTNLVNCVVEEGNSHWADVVTEINKQTDTDLESYQQADIDAENDYLPGGNECEKINQLPVASAEVSQKF